MRKWEQKEYEKTKRDPLLSRSPRSPQDSQRNDRHIYQRLRRQRKRQDREMDAPNTEHTDVIMQGEHGHGTRLTGQTYKEHE